MLDEDVKVAGSVNACEKKEVDATKARVVLRNILSFDLLVRWSRCEE